MTLNQVVCRVNSDRTSSGTKDIRELLKLDRYGVRVPDILGKLV